MLRGTLHHARLSARKDAPHHESWQFTNTHEPLVLAEVDEPTPGPGEVLIDIKAAGLCHSDVGLLEDEGWLRTLAKRPITIGHEVAGVISGLGEGVTGWRSRRPRRHLPHDRGGRPRLRP